MRVAPPLRVSANLKRGVVAEEKNFSPLRMGVRVVRDLVKLLEAIAKLINTIARLINSIKKK